MLRSSRRSIPTWLITVTDVNSLTATKRRSSSQLKKPAFLNERRRYSHVFAAADHRPVCWKHLCAMPAQPYITLRVRGGSNRYSMVVPDSCEALISKHTVPGETPEKIIVDLQSAVQREKLHASFEFAVEKPFYPSFLLNDNLEEICRLRHIFEEVTGEELKLVCSDGVSDNNHWSTIGGIPSVCFGPGGKGLHQSDEWVSTEQMENVLEVYLRFFLEDEE